MIKSLLNQIKDTHVDRQTDKHTELTKHTYWRVLRNILNKNQNKPIV